MFLSTLWHSFSNLTFPTLHYKVESIQSEEVWKDSDYKALLIIGAVFGWWFVIDIELCMIVWNVDIYDEFNWIMY